MCRAIPGVIDSHVNTYIPEFNSQDAIVLSVKIFESLYVKFTNCQRPISYFQI